MVVEAPNYLILFALVIVVGGVCIIGILLAVILIQRKQHRGSVRQPMVAHPIKNASPRVDSASNALFATLSHELRTPLNGLLGVAQVMKEESPSRDVESIEGCARHMLAVLEALLNLSKIQTEQEDLPEYREWVNLYDLLEQVKKDIAFRADTRGLRIELQHQDKSLRLRADADHLLAIIENTILGSIESVSLQGIPSQRLPLSVSWKAAGGNVEVHIINPREEVSDERREHIQEVFELTTGENHERVRMEYLYWAVASALLERYDGTMSPQPHSGGGVQTSLSFTMKQMQASASGGLPTGGLRLDVSGKTSKSLLELPVRLSIIVAEDDPITRRLMAAVLVNMGQDAQFAINGLEALDLVRSTPSCDLILMDIDMPVMDGVAAAKALRAGEAGDWGKVLPIVGVTAFSALSDQGKFKRVGMDYFLPKPVKLPKLREVLQDVIRKEKREGRGD